MDIYRLVTTEKAYGGTIYEQMVEEVLSSAPGIRMSQLKYQWRWKKPWKYLEVFSMLRFLWKVRSQQGSWVIRTLESCLIPPGANSIFLVFHVDWNSSSLVSKVVQIWSWMVFRATASKSAPIVVISKYWEEFLKERGYKNIHLIYCAYHYEDYVVTDSDLKHFLEANQLQEKKIVYVGNPQLKKGADLALSIIQKLNDKSVVAIASGEGDLDIPVLKLKLNFKEYLCLLKAASVVMTLSRFKEGWNRVAHEAMIMGTPVIGSGRGGMGELLEITSQSRVPSLDSEIVEKYVRQKLERKDELSEKAKNYVYSFNILDFQKKWIGLIDGLRSKIS
ncbi:MAG: glycosyltransferase [Bdellovibrionota bacterium]